MTKANRSRGMPRRTAKPAAETNRSRWILVGGGIGVVALAAVVAIVLGLGSSGGPPEPAADPIVITGAALPDLPQQGSDPAVGTTLPTLSGIGMDGEPMEIGTSGGPRMIVALAHWCPHCQAELPMLVDLIASGDVPDGVSVVGLSTGISELRPNYPPSDWFDREGWVQPTLIDDAESDALQALGMPRFPGFIFVDNQGVVRLRMTGEVDRQVLIQAMESIATP